MQLRSATAGNLGLLAEMNRRLIEDEGSTNPMDLEQLRERMRGWLESTYYAVLFERNEVVGYALYRVENERFRERRVIYLRQFFIERSYRGRGLDREAFTKLRQAFFKDALLRLEVLTTNPGGLAFWKRLGFDTDSVQFPITEKSVR